MFSSILAFVLLFNTALTAPSGGRCGVAFNNATCSKSCCSHAGYCGTTEQFCSVPNNCQEDFGWCDSSIMPKGLDLSYGKRKYSKDLPFKVEKCTVPKTLALTFDDGPTEYTDALLNVLHLHGARATFFVAGVNNGHGQLDIRWQDTITAMIMRGHQVGSHTWSHPNLDKLSSAARKMEMYKTERSIVNIIGKMPTFMRPPMVICGDECMKDMEELAYHVAGWEVDSQDWHDPQPSVQNTTVRLVNEMRQRDNMFLIQHDTTQATVDIVHNLLTQMPSDWKAVPLVECLGHSLDDAFQYPEYLEFNSGTPPACLDVGPAMCLPNTLPFNSKETCLLTAGGMLSWASFCHVADMTDPDHGLNLTIQAKAHCHHGENMAKATAEFCMKCKIDEPCDSNLLRYKDL